MDQTEYLNLTCREFSDRLASNEPTPGGGGAAAYCGALGLALLAMVGNCTLGKKAYAAAEPQVRELVDRAESLRGELLAGVNADAAAFWPLSQAYGLPTNTEAEKAAKQQRLAECSLAAARLPLRLAELCGQGLEIGAKLAGLGSRLVISDAACGAALLLAAQKSLAATVRINLGALTAAGGGYAEFAREAEERLAELIPAGAELERQTAATAGERMLK